MAQLLVRNIPESLVKALKLRAAEHGVSAEEEHRRILQNVIVEADKNANEVKIRSLLDIFGTGETDDADDWLFDRNDSRHKKPIRRDQGLLED